MEKQGFDEVLMYSGCFPFKRRISFIVIILGVLQIEEKENHHVSCEKRNQEKPVWPLATTCRAPSKDTPGTCRVTYA